MRKRRKNPVIQHIKIEKMAAEGKCVARHEGVVIFVSHVAPGDIVDLRVTKQKKQYMEAVPVHFHHYAEQRVTPFCEHFGTCGGCKWQHIPYALQLQYKQQQVVDNFHRIGKIALPAISPILPSDETRYYRNKLEFAFSSKRWLTREEIETEKTYNRNALGFHIPQNFDKILQIQHCYLQPDPSNEIRLAVDAFAKSKGYAYYDAVTHQGLLRTITIRTSSLNETMVVVQFGGDALEEEAAAQVEALLTYIKNTFPEVTSLQYVINPKKNDTYHDLEVNLYHGKPYITETMEGLQFRISAKSFYQTNADQAYKLYQTVRDFANLQGHEVVYDLYTGTGTIANFVASRAKKVVGLEYVEEAIEDAKVNARINDIPNTSFFAGDIKDLLQDDFVQQHGKPDVIITDPPRTGMHPDVVNKLLDIQAPRIVYVSCSPATQARDIAILDSHYQVIKWQPVDMFPHTHHVENVALLELNT